MWSPVGTLPVDRAELAQADGKRPDSFCFESACENITVAWPTKLTLAPLMANQLLQQLDNVTKSSITELQLGATPELAETPWQEAFNV